MAIEKLKFLVTADTKNFALGMKAVAALAVTAFAAVVKVTADFEKQLSKLRAVSGANVKQMKSLEKQSRNLGKSTAFTATEVASLQVELAKLGFTTNEILNASGGVLDLAAGLGVELSDAAKLTGSTIRAFGLDTEDTRRVVDIFAKAAATSALDFTKLTESLKLAAPISKAANVSLEKTVGILATLANNGIHGSMAGTGLAKVFVTVAKTGRPLNELLKEINTSEDKLATATQLFGLRANKVALIMAEQATPAMKDFNGEAEKQRETMEDNLTGDWDKFVSATTDLGLTLGNSTNPQLRNLTQWLTKIAGLISDDIDFEDFRRKVEDFANLEGKVKKFGKTFEETIKNSLTDKGKEGIDDLVTLKKRYDKFFIEDLIGPQIDSEDFINADTQDALIAYFNSLGANITRADLKTEKFAKTYKKLLTAISANNLEDLGDSGHSGGKKPKPKPKSTKTPVLSDYLSDLSHMLTLERQAGKSRYELAEAELAWLEALDKTTLSASQQEDVFKRTQVLTQGLATGFFDAAKEIDTFEQDLQGLFDLLLTSEEIFVRDWKAKLKGWLDNNKITFEKYIEYLDILDKAMSKKAGEGLSEAGQILNNGITNMIQSAAEAFASGENLGEGLLSGIGAILTQLGGLLIVTGLGIKAFKESLKSLNPTVAIVAGVALVVAGAAFSNAAKKAGGGVGNTPATRSPVGSSTTTPSSIQGSGNGGELVATVRGQDLRFILQAADNSYTALS